MMRKIRRQEINFVSNDHERTDLVFDVWNRPAIQFAKSCGAIGNSGAVLHRLILPRTLRLSGLDFNAPPPSLIEYNLNLRCFCEVALCEVTGGDIGISRQPGDVFSIPNLLPLRSGIYSRLYPST
jgi:hypothetical protein